MAKFGPKSSAEAEFEEKHGPVVDDGGRPPAPEKLSPEGKEVWDRVVNAMGPGYFGAETHDLLKDFCRHTVFSDRLAPMVDRALEDLDAIGIADPEVVKASDRVAAMHERQVRAASSLATRLRITNQATRTADQGRGKPKEDGPPIWEDY